MSYVVNCFISWGNVLNLFMAIIYEWAKSARVFVPGKIFQLILMFEGKSRSLPKSGFTRVGSGLH